MLAMGEFSRHLLFCALSPPPPPPPLPPPPFLRLASNVRPRTRRFYSIPFSSCASFRVFNLTLLCSLLCSRTAGRVGKHQGQGRGRGAAPIGYVWKEGKERGRRRELIHNKAHSVLFPLSMSHFVVNESSQQSSLSPPQLCRTSLGSSFPPTSFLPSLPPSLSPFPYPGIVGVKSPLFRIDKAIKAVQEALLEGELGEEVREGREEEEEEEMEGGRAGVAGHMGVDCEGGVGGLARGHLSSLFEPLFVRRLQQSPFFTLYSLVANLPSHVSPLSFSRPLFSPPSFRWATP